MVRALVPLTRRVPRTLLGLHQEMEGLFNVAFHHDNDNGKVWTPRLNIVETDRQYEVSVELPGISSEDVTIELEDGKLTIEGEVGHEMKDEGTTFHCVERRFGKFQRIISVADTVEPDKIVAEFENGILTVSLPKAEQVKPKRIEVSSKR